MAHNEHNRPKSSGIILIAIGILIFFFAPKYYNQNLMEGLTAIILGFIIGGIGFYIAFIKKRK